MSKEYPYPPPADAKEWTCEFCGGDSLWCGCFTDLPMHLHRIAEALQDENLDDWRYVEEAPKRLAASGAPPHQENKESEKP